MIHRPRHVVLVCGGRDYDTAAASITFSTVSLPYAFLVRIQRRGSRCRHPGRDGGGERHTHVAVSRILPEDWEAHGRLAGPIRNAPMIREGKPDVVIAFPGGPGTAQTCGASALSRTALWCCLKKGVKTAARTPA